MRKLLNISIGSVRLSVVAYVLVNIVAFFFVSSSVADSQHFALSTKSLKGDCSFFICNESEKDGEEDAKMAARSFAATVHYFLPKHVDEAVSFSSKHWVVQPIKIYLQHRSLLI